MNLRTRSLSKSQSPQSPQSDSKSTTPKSRKSNSPRPPSASRRKPSDIAETKAKRVRTGCLTCRERHLKCDEALGRCLNCRKSDRICRRGVRLNFIDIQTVAPPHVIAHPHGAKVTFRDDSRFIASEYVGGYERYPPVQPDSPVTERRQLYHDTFNLMGHDQLASLFQSVAHSFDPVDFEASHSTADFLLGDTWHEPHLMPGDELLPHGTSNFARKLATKQQDHASLSDQEQVHLLQVFVDEVAPWLDSMDSTKHFTEILPFHAIDEPMLLKSFLACGARHLCLVNPSFSEEKAIHFYKAATQDLIHSMQDPNRDSVLCATAAVVLGMYEVMAPQSIPKTNHLQGSRALIHECGWTAKTPGLGGTCFWISVVTELLSCLHHGWSFSWSPDSWGVDMDMGQAHLFGKGEDLWLHRIIYICAKITNLKVAVHQLQSLTGASTQAARLNETLQEWAHYNTLCEQWEKSVPRSLHPLGLISPWQTAQPLFPKIWLIKPSAILAQLLYNTARILLTHSHPSKLELHEPQQTYAYKTCGIAASVKDRSIANVTIRCLAIAAECLQTQEAQEKALHIMDTISQGTIWHTEPIKQDLKRVWGWHATHSETVDPAQMHNPYYGLDPALPLHQETDFLPGIINPLFNAADFSLEGHPYQGSYVAPHHTIDHFNYAPYLV